MLVVNCLWMLCFGNYEIEFNNGLQGFDLYFVCYMLLENGMYFFGCWYSFCVSFVLFVLFDVDDVVYQDVVVFVGGFVLFVLVVSIGCLLIEFGMLFYVCGYSNGEQMCWFECMLCYVVYDDDIDWIVVQMYQDVFSLLKMGNGFDKGICEVWLLLFDCYGVDFVLCGYDYDYECSYLVCGCNYCVGVDVKIGEVVEMLQLCLVGLNDLNWMMFDMSYGMIYLIFGGGGISVLFDVYGENLLIGFVQVKVFMKLNWLVFGIVLNMFVCQLVDVFEDVIWFVCCDMGIGYGIVVFDYDLGKLGGYMMIMMCYYYVLGVDQYLIVQYELFEMIELSKKWYEW